MRRPLNLLAAALLSGWLLLAGAGAARVQAQRSVATFTVIGDAGQPNPGGGETDGEPDGTETGGTDSTGGTDNSSGTDNGGTTNGSTDGSGGTDSGATGTGGSGGSSSGGSGSGTVGSGQGGGSTGNASGSGATGGPEATAGSGNASSGAGSTTGTAGETAAAGNVNLPQTGGASPRVAAATGWLLMGLVATAAGLHRRRAAA
ncbi:hypothetical protein [Lacticaseibacillus suihuaensis]